MQEKENQKCGRFVAQNSETGSPDETDNGTDSDTEDDGNEYESEERDSDLDVDGLDEDNDIVSNESTNEGEVEEDETEEGHDSFDLPDTVSYRRMPCMAHTLQLIIHIAHKTHYKGVIGKARQIVGRLRRSSVLVEKLVEKCGKQVISDCTTRWNSTYQMAKRLLEIKNYVNDVLDEAKIDTLLASEWTKLEEMTNLLEPFATTTDILQTDSHSVS